MSVPGATYRLQLHAGLTFDDVAAQADYLASLGVTHLYLSPSLQAAPGSMHGYDIVDPTRLNDELGGHEAFARLVERTRDLGLGLVMDIVPNHVGLLSPLNPWWWDVLRHGPGGRFARHFDIRWRRRGDGPPQVLVPELARPLEDELASSEVLRLAHSEPPNDSDRGDNDRGDDDRGDSTGNDPSAGYRIVYHDHAWPVRPGSLKALGHDPSDVGSTLHAVNSRRGELFSLLLDQHYQLVHWRRANDELNYRRFFDITTLGGVRVEDPAVFDDAHRAVLRLVADGAVDGLRIDHSDGLADPLGYFQALREAAPEAWIVTEKILERDETLRRDWPIDGTVGYEFATDVLGLFVDPTGDVLLSELYRSCTGETQPYVELVEDAKRQVLDTMFRAELEHLTDLLVAVADEARVVEDRHSLADALREVLVAFDVYRTYIRPYHGSLDASDRRLVGFAGSRAHIRRPELADAIDLITEVLLLEQGGEHTAELVTRFQQLTGPVMAKGVEDTAFYRYLRFVALNEVGGDPSHSSTTIAEFHEHNRKRQRDWPSSMLSTSTHDTKRSEDVRARLAVLSELPDLWVRTIDEWRTLVAPHRGVTGPSPRHELLTFQTVVGAWPINENRLIAYLVKAARESKQESDWLDPDEAYEHDLAAFARGLLADRDFLATLSSLLDAIIEPGRLTALSQTLLKLTSPGVPDVYQGCELWDLSLVDPDNRRPVDVGLRRRLLADSSRQPHPVDLLAGMDQGIPKLWVIHRALQLRRDRQRVFGPGSTYLPLHATGACADHLVAFVRGGEAITLAPRLVVGLGGRFPAWEWHDTRIVLPEGRWRCVLSGQLAQGGDDHVLIEELLAAFPVGLLVREDGS